MMDTKLEQALIDYAESLDVSQPPDVWENAEHGFYYTAVHAAWNGFRVTPLKWGQKRPAPRNWTITATDDEPTLREWSKEARDGWGIGLIPTQTRHGQRVVLDADTADAYVFLKALLGAPTVITAGRNSGAHKGGAHWYITLDEPIPGLSISAGKPWGIDIFGGDGSQDRQVVGAGSYVCMNTDGTPITPGYYHDVVSGSGFSTPTTFPYLYNKINAPLAHDHPLYGWLRDVAAQQIRSNSTVIRPSGTPRQERTALDEWSRTTSWQSLLEADGWTWTGTEPCGCDQWEHPWGASIPRSAVAHVEGCAQSRSDFPGGALHLFSVNAQNACGGDASVSKYTYVTHVRYGGDWRVAREGEGIPDESDYGSGCALDLSSLGLEAS